MLRLAALVVAVIASLLNVVIAGLDVSVKDIHDSPIPWFVLIWIPILSTVGQWVLFARGNYGLALVVCFVPLVLNIIIPGIIMMVGLGHFH